MRGPIMTDTTATQFRENAPHGPSGTAVHGPSLRAYLVVAVALAIFTAVSFIVNQLEQMVGLSVMLGFLIILLVAICKATLVTMYFMHVKYDWKLLYFMLIPAFILATMMMCVLMPDIVNAWHNIEPITSK
jgi:caa(3)-type oxidase subunit IV